MSFLVKNLTDLLGEDAVVTGDALAERATSYWNSAPAQALALVRPKTTEEVSQVLELCHRHNQPVVTHGGLTGCTQGAEATPRDIILSLERMSAIEKVDDVNCTAVVQAGAVLQVVQETLAALHLLFPLDLGARGSCTIGGNIATNAGGINVLRYGMMRQLVLGLEAVLADGTVISSMNQMLKNNSGYDLKQLFIGTEGTLGIVTRAVIKLFPQPRSCNTALVALEDFDSVAQLLNSLRRDLAGTLSAFELMWGDYFHAVTEEKYHRAPMHREYPFYVIMEAEGADPESDGERFGHILEKLLEAKVIVDAVIPKSETERRALWEIRENFEPILKTQPNYLYDISLPIGDMPAYVDQVKQGLKSRWPESFCYVLGHIADGNLHLFVTPNQGADLHHQCDQEIYEPLKIFRGAVSAEHGIGLEKKPWLSYSRSPQEIALMQRLKEMLDPKQILNPGRVFDL